MLFDGLIPGVVWHLVGCASETVAEASGNNAHSNSSRQGTEALRRLWDQEIASQDPSFPPSPSSAAGFHFHSETPSASPPWDGKN
jgi:hypothetical protein